MHIKIYCFINVHQVHVLLCLKFILDHLIFFFILIVSYICNEQNSTLVNVTMNILLFLNVYYN